MPARPAAARRRRRAAGPIWTRGCGGLPAGGRRAMLHGHTHRPGASTLAPGFERQVLSDWDLDGPAARRSAAPAPRRPHAAVAGVGHAGLMRAPVAAAAPAQRAACGRAPRHSRCACWQLTLARYPFLARRDAADLAELRRLSSLFLDSKEFAVPTACRSATTWPWPLPRRPACRCCAWACGPSTASSASSCSPTRCRCGANSSTTTASCTSTTTCSPARRWKAAR